MTLPPIASLWIGGDLSWVEQVCLKSFADQGHDVTLFTYGPVTGIPEGVTARDANEILPGDDIIRHERTGSPAYHADRFRLCLMRDTDFVWVDTDAYAHAPMVLPDHGHMHGHLGPEGSLINNGVLRLPKDSETLARMLEFTDELYPVPPWFSAKEQAELLKRKETGEPVHVSKLPWGVWGPNALTHFLKETGENRFSLPQEVLYPVPFDSKTMFFRPVKRPTIEAMITERTLSVHLWGRRFRRVAAGQKIAPPKGSYAADICARHGVDPLETLHILLDTHTPDGTEVDFSAFDVGDLANICLQRSEILDDQSVVAAWTKGDDAPLLAYAKRAKNAIPAQAFAEMSSQFAHIRPRTDAKPPRRVADIGCGYGFLDLILWRTYDCDLVLIDIEESASRHFGFDQTGAGYSSLSVAREFLLSNGVPETKITTVNPSSYDISTLGSFDLAVSFLSCGFHYGLDTYDSFFRTQIESGGAIIVDVRKGSRGIRYLKELGEVSILSDERKHAKVLVET